MRLAQGRMPSSYPAADRFPAGLLFCDISGFTVLTERLQGAGREGAEEVWDVINRAFLPVIEAIHSQGGSIISFGGDAVFAVFPDPGGSVRARLAAERIREQFERQPSFPTSVGPITLGISQAVHHGIVHGLHLGRAEQAHYHATGPSVTALARLEGKADRGEVAVSVAVRARVRGMPSALEPRGDDLSSDLPGAAVLGAYLPPRLRALAGNLEGGYRRLTCLFLETRGWSMRLLQAFYLRLTGLLDDVDGLLLKSDLSGKGAKWIAVFGFPVAHEDDPNRAAQVAAGLLKGLPAQFRFRGGIHEGVVVNIEVGNARRRSLDIMGDAVNTTARAMSCAHWGQVMMTDSLVARLHGAETELQGSFRVKGKAKPLRLYSLLGRSRSCRRLRVDAPIVGRAEDLAGLVRRLPEARDGLGRILTIQGEAGIGKSRLKEELASRARALGFTVAEGAAQSFGDPAYGAIGRLIQSCLPDGAGSEFERVWQEGRRLGLSEIDCHHLGAILGHRQPGSPLDQLEPKAIRLNSLLAIRYFLLALARERPHLYVIEDLHWADEATRDAVRHLAAAIGEYPAVLLILSRPGCELPRSHEACVLSELSQKAIGSMLQALLGEGVSDPLRDLVAGRSGGNPLYVEELVRHLRESGLLREQEGRLTLDREPGREELPPTIEALIAARLDRLAPDARRVTRVAAILGREFDGGLLDRFQEVRSELPTVLVELRERQILVKAAGSRLAFRHVLTREVAYGSILVRHRRRLHRRAAEAIEEQFSHDRELHLPALGHHWEYAGEAARAVEAYRGAGHQASGTGAQLEAMEFFSSALRLLKPEEERIRLDLLRDRASAEKFHGFLHKAGEDLAIARDLARKLALPREEVEVVLETAEIAGRRGDLDRLAAEAEKAGVLARCHSLLQQEIRAKSFMGRVEFRQGRADQALEMVQKAIVLARELGEPKLEALLLDQQGTMESFQGAFEKAIDTLDRALELCRQHGDHRRGVSVLNDLATVYYRRGDWERTDRVFRQALDLCQKTGDRYLVAVVLGNLGTVAAQRREIEVAAGYFQQAAELCKEIGDGDGRRRHVGNLASLWRIMGRLGEALEAFEQLGSQQAEAGSIEEQTLVWFNLGSVLVDLGEFPRAGELLDACVASSRERKDRVQLCDALQLQGEIAWLNSDRREAGKKWREAHRLANEIGYTEVEILARICQWLPGNREPMKSEKDLLGVAAFLEGHRDSDLFLEAALCFAEVALEYSSLSSIVRRASALLSDAREEMVSTGARRQLYLAHWFQSRLLQVQGDGVAAKAALREARKEEARMEENLPTGLAQVFHRHPRVRPLWEPLNRGSRDL